MVKFLHAMGKHIIATDIDESKKAVAGELNRLGIKTEIGFHDHNTFNGAGVMIPSPGIPLDNKFIKTALKNGVEIKGELDIFSQYNDLPVIAITGTNGKTTVTTLTGEILRHSRMRPFVGGNIGTPLVEHLMSEKKADIIVAEVSSFQLDLATQFRPDIAVLLNISEDHLDRYENYNDYTSSKWSLFKNQRSSDKAIINLSIQGVAGRCSELKSEVFTFSSSEMKNAPGMSGDERNMLEKCNAFIRPENIKIRLKDKQDSVHARQMEKLSGIHERENLAAAALASLAAGSDFQCVLKALETFKKPAHRIEFVKTIKGISFYNDSKATNTDAVIRAIACFKKNIILILGGREKTTDFSLLSDHIKKSVKTIIAMGESCRTIKETFEKLYPVRSVQTMKQAVQEAFSIADKNDIVLLSPACASFDMYESYAHRGDDFKNCVEALDRD